MSVREFNQWRAYFSAKGKVADMFAKQRKR